MPFASGASSHWLSCAKRVRRQDRLGREYQWLRAEAAPEGVVVWVEENHLEGVGGAVEVSLVISEVGSGPLRVRLVASWTSACIGSHRCRSRGSRLPSWSRRRRLREPRYLTTRPRTDRRRGEPVVCSALLPETAERPPRSSGAGTVALRWPRCDRSACQRCDVVSGRRTTCVDATRFVRIPP